MNNMQFITEINAPKEAVWNTLWNDATFRQWAGIIDPGTYMIGDLKEGSEVQFISAENGYGVTSLVEKLTPNEFLLLRHSADTQNTGKEERTKEWTGGVEIYSLKENGGTTTLTVAFDVPVKMEEYFKLNYPKALDQVKIFSEESINS